MGFLVGRPVLIFVVALLLLGGYLLRRFGQQQPSPRTLPLLIAAGAWALYAAWEWLVLIRTPEANIRVDLLLILPVVALLTLWALYRTLR